VTIRWVRTTCDRCSTVVVPRQEVLLTHFPTGPIYTFPCPVCRRRIVREPSERDVAKLTDAGVRVHRISLPPRPDRDDPPITADELLDFVLDLRATDDPLDELA
jgi:hypothetical protein